MRLNKRRLAVPESAIFGDHPTMRSTEAMTATHTAAPAPSTEA